ncbi:MAG TPA: YaiI/YqxD family protein [Burkholderiales bacterium]
MRIWVDADACPNVIKDILFRAAERAKVTLTLVANQPLRTPPSQYIRSVQVPAGFDAADNRIVELAESGDLVVTADIPLAAGALGKGAKALDPRGELYTPDNIKEKLAVRKLMDELRSSGVDTGGPAIFGAADRQAFANRLDRLLQASGAR